jgi:MFS family permease
VFRALWIASVASNIGTWMQSVGAAWLMTSLTSSALLVALLQTATSLPVFLVGLPAGALADVIDRRHVLLVTQAWMLATACLLGALTLAGAMSDWGLLALTFLLGLGAALNAPAWQAIVPELVGRRDLAVAVALNSAGFNLARAVGPALGGLVVAALGPGAVFLLNAASYLGVLLVIYRWQRRPETTTAPSERVFGAIQAGVRYARHAPRLQAVLVRTGTFIFAASALWALLPVVARNELGLDATGYGVLLGSLGLGAVGGAALLPRFRRALPVDRLVVAATVVFAVATLALGFIPNLLLLDATLIAGGIAWITLTSSLNVSAQSTAPAWVRARVLGVYLLVFQGGLAAGSFVWGELATEFGNPAALGGAALALLVGAAVARRWRLQPVEEIDLTPALYFAEPRLILEPDPEDGPVLVTAEYQVPNANARAFVQAMEAVGRHRRRDGAMRWGLFRDPAAPEHYIETFVVASWAEHMRQHERATASDETTRAHALTFVAPGTAPVVAHYIAAQALNPDPAAAPATPVAATEGASNP